MKHDWKRFLGIALILFLLFNPGMPFAWAENLVDYTAGISQKFGRGVVNVLSSPLEIPCTTANEFEDKGAAGIGLGLFKGFVFFFRRFFVGLAEGATFVIPMGPTLPDVCQERHKPAVHQP